MIKSSIGNSLSQLEETNPEHHGDLLTFPIFESGDATCVERAIMSFMNCL